MPVKSVVTMNPDGSQSSVLLNQAANVLEREFKSAELEAIIQDLIDTMNASPAPGIAAPQIGVDKKIVVFGGESKNFKDFNQPLTVLINPTYEPQGDEKVMLWEHCLSLPGKRGKTERYKKIRYTAFDYEGNKTVKEATGLLAVLLQHEVDHLSGILFCDVLKKDDVGETEFADITVCEERYGKDHHKVFGMQDVTHDEESCFPCFGKRR